MEKHESISHREEVTGEVQNTIGIISEEALGNNLPEGYYRTWSFVGTVAALILAALTSYFFVILSTNILTYINADIGPSTASSWVSVGRTLGLTLSYTLIGRLSDIFGRRWFFIGGGVIALIGNIICATSYSMTQLIVGATVYGIGEATQLCFAIAIGELIKNKHRPIVVSLMFGTTAPISTFGPLIARKFVQHPNLGWRWCFYLAIICNGLSVILFYVFYHPPSFQMLHLEGKTVKQQIKLLDFWGIGFLCSGATLLLLGISWGGSSYPWMSAGSIAPIVIGGTLLVVFVIYEAMVTQPYPIVPFYLFSNRGYISLLICASVASMFYYSALLLWPQQISVMYTKDIIYAGWLSTTISGGTSLGQLLAGGIIKYVKRTRILMIFSACAMVGLLSGMASLTPNTKAVGITLSLLGSFCVGFIELTSLAVAPLFCAPEDIGLAIGFISAVRSLGGSISVTVYVAIRNNRLLTTVPQAIYSPALAAGYSPSALPALLTAAQAGTLSTLPGATPAVISAVNAALPYGYAAAYKTVYLASLAFGAIALIGSVLSKDPQKHLTDEITRKLHGRDIKKGDVGQDKPLEV